MGRRLLEVGVLYNCLLEVRRSLRSGAFHGSAFIRGRRSLQLFARSAEFFKERCFSWVGVY